MIPPYQLASQTVNPVTHNQETSGSIRISSQLWEVVPDVEIMVFIQFASRLSKLTYRSTSSVIFKSLLPKLRLRTSYNLAARKKTVTKTLIPVDSHIAELGGVADWKVITGDSVQRSSQLPR